MPYLVGCEQIIRVQKLNPWATAPPRSHVAREAGATILAHCNDVGLQSIFREQLSRDCNTLIRRSVIDEDELHRFGLDSLLLHAADRVLYPFRRVVQRHDDRDQW